MKYILHIDLNAFYASVEEIENPEYKNKPLIVAGHNKRGIVGSPNYLARKYKIHSGMSVSSALKLCPNLVICSTNHLLYRQYSILFFDLLKSKFQNPLEITSIDECYMDITKKVNSINQAINYAINIQTTILHELGLSISVGIANNKFTAKMACNLKKPLGITSCFGLKEFQQKIWILPIEEFLFIGKKTIPLLKKNNIKKIQDFATFKDNQILKNIFKNQFESFMANAWNKGDDVLNCENHIPKTISAETTFLEKVEDFNFLKNTIKKLAENVAERMQEHELECKHLILKIKYEYNDVIQFSLAKQPITQDWKEVYLMALKIFEHYKLNIKPILLLGIQLNNLKKISKQINFEQINYKNENKLNELNEIIKKVKKITKNQIKIQIAKN